MFHILFQFVSHLRGKKSTNTNSSVTKEVNKMKKTLIVGLVLSLSLLIAGSAFAGRGGGYGMMGGGYGMMEYGSRYDSSVDVEAVKKFQKETLELRDELIVKRAELAQEYYKSDPDTGRVAQLRKDMIDIEVRIIKVAEKYDIEGGSRGARRGDGGYNFDGPRNCSWN
jgi:zinc resistance-associated protein